MGYIKLFLLNFQRVFEERARTFVWMLLAVVNPLLMILFWKGAKISGTGMTFSSISSYYLLLVVGGSFLVSHVEGNISEIDIQEGRLASYLLKPFSYFALKWEEELPYRVLQGSFGFMALFIFIFIFNIKITSFVSGMFNIFLTTLIVLGSLSLAQVYKMIVGFASFWTVDAYGFFELSEMLLFVFAGYIAPLSLYPQPVANISYILPFSYLIYFPISAVQGIFSTKQLLLVFLGELIWIFISILIYRLLWMNGVKRFTGVGQ